MKKERFTPHASPVDEGVSVYDRDRVEDVDFKDDYFSLVQTAVTVFGQNNRPRDIFNLYRGSKPRMQDPIEFMLPDGVDPHDPIKHLAKACIDVTRGYGLSSIISVDTAKAARFARATDLAIDKIGRQKQAGLLGFAFVVIRYEDWPNTTHEGLREALLNGDGAQAVPEVSEDEAERLARVDRLRRSVGELNVPSMHLLTMEAHEATPDFGAESMDPGIDPGTRLY